VDESCQPKEQTPTGQSCTSDRGCTGGFCLSGRALGLEQAGDQRFCTIACCADVDCPTETRCVVADNGIRACVPETILSGSNNSGTALLAGGGTCQADEECLSGLCRSESCMYQCARDSDCIATESCTVQQSLIPALGVGGILVCDSLGMGSADPGTTCYVIETCKSRLCIENRCAEPCGSNADCDAGQICDYRNSISWWGGSTRFAVCTNTATGTTPMGGSCSSSDDCDGARCVNQVCASVCCTDSDCGQNGLTCGPVEESDGWGIYCTE
jgi:hypothetical protein